MNNQTHIIRTLKLSLKEHSFMYEYQQNHNTTLFAVTTIIRKGSRLLIQTLECVCIIIITLSNWVFWTQIVHATNISMA